MSARGAAGRKSGTSAPASPPPATSAAPAVSATSADYDARAAGGALVRAMAADDLKVVARLERETFTMPWSAATFRGLLRRHDVCALVAELDGAVVAYAVCWSVYEQGELANIAVVPAARGMGVGGRLLSHVLQRMEERGVRQLYLEVRVSNEAAQAFYRGFGFREVGRRPAYYARPTEDAIVLYRPLGAADDAGTGEGAEA